MKGFGFTLLFISNFCLAQQVIFVSDKGSDDNKGTLASPLKTLNNAVSRALAYKGKQVTINLRSGTYYLTQTISINAEDYDLKSLLITAYKSEKVTLSGAMPLQLTWMPFKDKIMQAKIDLKTAPDKLMMGEKDLPMARYPNYDSTARVFNGTAGDALEKERTSRWKKPAGGYVHALHRGEWGGFHYRIVGMNNNEPVLEGGWQNNRPAPMHNEHRFVENIFEELDAPGEWYYDSTSKTIYLYPTDRTDNAKYSVSQLNDLIVLKGNEQVPVKNITINNIHFTGTNRTFMLTKEPLLRSDWTIYRGGAILLDGTENITISNCTFSGLGGNAVFVSNYNRKVNITDNHIHNIGANAICFVGSADAVRSPSFRYEHFVPWNEMDFTPGPKTNNYPKQCVARGNLIHNIGNIEKQVAGIQISMSSKINASHNTIYEVPRSGINIGDGCWGGHVIEFNDVFYTVLETGDHGAFNSWGRDRFWRPEREITDSIVEKIKGIELLDVIDPITLRNNRFHCEHGWDIDLDDGSTNYHIYNNVCLNGGLKLREGYHRVVRNNIIVNNTFHPHVWYKNSRDIFANNIVFLSYAPIMVNNWGKMVDSNFFVSPNGVLLSQLNGTDLHSISGDPKFVNTSKKDFTVSKGSGAFKMGFVNFPMQFGVTSPALKKLAKQAPAPAVINEYVMKGVQTDWLGTKLKNVETLGERSAAGLPDNKGVLVVTVPSASVAGKSGLRAGDVIIRAGNEPASSVNDFLGIVQKMRWMGSLEVVILRNQQEQKINLKVKE